MQRQKNKKGTDSLIKTLIERSKREGRAMVMLYMHNSKQVQLKTSTDDEGFAIMLHSLMIDNKAVEKAVKKAIRYNRKERWRILVARLKFWKKS